MICFFFVRGLASTRPAGSTRLLLYILTAKADLQKKTLFIYLIRTHICMLPSCFSPRDPWAPQQGLPPLVGRNRLIPQHGPLHSASVTGEIFVLKREGCVCQTVDWNTQDPLLSPQTILHVVNLSQRISPRQVYTFCGFI